MHSRCHALASTSSVRCPSVTSLPYPDEQQDVPLNRFALDYYKHGQKAALVAANGLREGDAWQVGRLNDPRCALYGRGTCVHETQRTRCHNPPAPCIDLNSALPGTCQRCTRCARRVLPTPAPLPVHPSSQMLRSFSDILRVVAVSLARLLPPTASGTDAKGASGEEVFNPVAYSIDRLARDFATKFRHFNDALGPRGGY